MHSSPLVRTLAVSSRIERQTLPRMKPWQSTDSPAFHVFICSQRELWLSVTLQASYRAFMLCRQFLFIVSDRGIKSFATLTLEYCGTKYRLFYVFTGTMLS